MWRYLPYIIAALITLYCVVDVVIARSDVVRRMPKWMWAVAVLLAPIIGPVAWLVWGRPTKLSIARVDRPPTPDDDPDFLRGLG